MTRLCVFCEGQTEQAFADLVLGPHLLSHGIERIHPCLVKATRKRKGSHSGGWIDYGACKQDLLDTMQYDRNRDVYFTTMLDLYRIPSDFPGLAEADIFSNHPENRIALLEAAFSADIGHPSFIPYLQLHEFEAVLFSDVTQFEYLGASDRIISAFQQTVTEFPTPEHINSVDAPSKRIIDVLPGYAKVSDGPELAQLIGLPAIRAKCPHFHAWITKLESLGAAPHMPLQHPDAGL